MKAPVKNQYFLVGLFEKMIRNSKSGRRLKPDGSRIRKGTIRNYEYCLKLIREYEEKRKVRLRIMIRPTLRVLKSEKRYWKRFYKDFTDFLYRDKGHYDNYVGQTIKNLRVLFSYAESELSLFTGQVQKCFYVRKYEPPIFPLLPEELHFLIEDTGFSHRLSHRLRRVKDFFVFGCTVALRVSDLMKLTVANLRIVQDAHYLEVRATKTGIDTMLKLPPYAVDIVRRSKRYGRLLPKFSLPNLNKHIKQLLREAGFIQPVQKVRTVRGRIVESTNKTRFCDIASSHTMRRTAITTMLSLGVPEPVVRKISGHNPGSKEFYRYVRWAQSYQDTETQKMFDKLVSPDMHQANAF